MALPLGLSAQKDEVTIPADDPVLRQLDDLLLTTWVRHDRFTTDTARLNVNGFPPAEVPTYPARIYEQRLALLDQRTPLDLTFNPAVQAYIELYAVKKREQTSRMLGLAELYFPVFEDALDRYGIPQELKYLAMVESALNPAARSRAGAVGLWQFITSTGKLYGMRIDSYVDERCDIYKSTDAACRYLKDLYGIFGDWDLALAAYNCGPGNVNKAIRRCGGKKDYWEAYSYLPRETRGYVPAFIAVNYIMHHAADHNLYPIAPSYCRYELDTVQVCYPVTLDLLADMTGADSSELRDLNPMFREGIVPDPDQPVTIYIPRDAVPAFINNEDSLRYAYLDQHAEERNAEQQVAPPHVAVHMVRRGESLGLIAQRNHVTVSQLKRWNGLHSDRIRPGQQLRIEQAPALASRRPAPVKPSPTPASPVEDTAEKSGIEYIYHVVQPGDTLWDIAKMYPGVTVEDLKRLNSGLNSRHLHPGHKIRVGIQQG
ncbi:MAG: LysM peptidoglycan-binding domain-containing protein [Flavobacteriales bacterium]|nr:LysM peptidoglycan-binding domain-containing protein [Flavobacteriales bacterium]